MLLQHKTDLNFVNATETGADRASSCTTETIVTEANAAFAARLTVIRLTWQIRRFDCPHHMMQWT